MVSVQTLSHLPLFEGIPESKLASLAPFWEEMNVKAGEVLFCEGCEAEKFYILLEGNVTLWMKLTSRPENLVLGVLNKYGQSFGWSVMVSGKHYTASADAKEDSQILAIDGQDLKNFLEEDTEVGFKIAMRMVDIVSSRLRYYRVLLKTF
jgi:CRP/FNR family cyclic AMP-dependent transcriptional regulator